MARAEIVGQRQFGIICPEQDKQVVDCLCTLSLVSCFGLSLRDPGCKMDFLTHLDYEDLLDSALDQALPIFESLGVRRLQMRVININPPKKARHLFEPEQLLKRRQELDRFAQRLVTLGLARYPRWRNLGTAMDVIIQSPKPIRVGEFSRLTLPNLTAETIQRYQKYTKWFDDTITKPGFQEAPGEYLIKVTPAYVPILS